MTQESLESNHATFREFRHPADIAGHNSTPDREVRYGCGLESRAFRIEVSSINRTGNRVERHVTEQCPAACGQSTAARSSAFPFRMARFVEVDMDVDQTWK